MCTKPIGMSCWVTKVEQDVVDIVFGRMWEFTYSAYTYFLLIEHTYTVVEEKDIYRQLKGEGLLDDW